MTQDLIQFPAMPAYLAKRAEQRPKPEKDPYAVGGGVQVPRVSLKNSRFTLIDKEVTIPLNTLDMHGIIVGVNPAKTKIYFDTIWDEDNPSPPACWSDDGKFPAEQVQNPVSRSCGVCPKDAWGSAITAQGVKVKACGDSKRVALLVDGKMYLLTIKGGSFKNWDAYVRFLKTGGNIPLTPEDVVTQFSFERTGVLQFIAKGYVPEKDAELQEKLRESEDYKLMLGLKDMPRLAHPESKHEPVFVPPPPPKPMDSGVKKTIARGDGAPKDLKEAMTKAFGV